MGPEKCPEIRVVWITGCPKVGVLLYLENSLFLKLYTTTRKYKLMVNAFIVSEVEFGLFFHIYFNND